LDFPVIGARKKECSYAQYVSFFILTDRNIKKKAEQGNLLNQPTNQ